MFCKTMQLLYLIILIGFFNSSASQTYKFVSREEWGALPANDTRPLITPVPYLIIHHTYIPGACYDQADCSAKMKGMQSYHAGLDWGDIGYHFCVGSDGAAYEGRGWHVVGIHAGNMNRISIGICLIGDWRTETPPRQQLVTTRDLISSGVNLGIIGKDYRLIGHDQAMPTECPGGALRREMETWKHYYNGTIGDRKKIDKP